MSALVTIFGCGGFLGGYIAEELLKRGYRVRAAERNPSKALKIKPLGNLGQTQFVSADIGDKASVLRAVSGSDIVINLVGTFGSAMQHIHVEGARNVAEAAAQAGARQLVHMSAIGADQNSPARYGQTKYVGEKAVRAAFPSATILRPSVIFADDDKFINMFAGLIRAAPIVPVIGAQTKFQPVFVGDVAKAVATVLEMPGEAGQTYELGGPEIFTMEELNAWIANAIGRKKPLFAVPSPLAQILAFLPGAPIDRDQLKMLKDDNIVSDGAKGFAELKITPAALRALAPRYLDKYREHGRFGRKISS